MRRLLFFAFVGCEGNNGPDTEFVLSGTARYPDADGVGPEESLRVFATIQGIGTYVEPACVTREPTGPFRAQVAGKAEIRPDGSWTLRVESSDAKLTTHDGCPLGGVEIASIRSATIRGALRPSPSACAAFGPTEGARAACLREGTSAIVAEKRVDLDLVPSPDVDLRTDLVFQRLERLDGTIVE